ncbi:MAG: hypothetical protein WC358_03685 [Ignavibacteria bacterium]|jgi:hypothetical protein
MKSSNVKIFIANFFLYTGIIILLFSNPITVAYLYKQQHTISKGVSYSLLAFNIICIIYIVLIIFAISSSKRGKSKMLNNLINISILIFFVSIVLFLVEVSFRTVFKSLLFQRPFEYSEFVGMDWLKPNLDVTYETSEYKTNFKTNKYGYRNNFDFSPKKKDEIRIINVGDSYIMAGQVALENTMSYKLEKYLNENESGKKYTVINNGKNGLSPKTYKEFFRRNIKLFDADYLISYIYVGNDIEDEMTSIKYSNESPNIFYAMFNSTIIVLSKYSYFFRYIDERLISKINFIYPAGGPCQPFDDRPDETSKNVFLKKYNDRITDGFTNLLNNTKELEKICNENNVKLLVAFIPTKEQVERDQFSKVINYYNIDTTKLDMRKPQKYISDFLNQNQIINIDLLDTLIEVSKSNKTYFDSDSHWNIYGNDIVARKMHTFLKDSILKN